MEGTNDSVFRTASSAVRVALQRMINVQIASGKETLLSTLAVPCCTHSSLAPYVDAYNVVIGELAEVNELALADMARTWRTSCPNPESCDLYNLPEGLHPNTKGYDAMAQTFAAALLDIDPYSSGGAADLAGAIGIPTEAIAIKPGV